jgi:hypothetical protein
MTLGSSSSPPCLVRHSLPSHSLWGVGKQLCIGDRENALVGCSLAIVGLPSIILSALIASQPSREWKDVKQVKMVLIMAVRSYVMARACSLSYPFWSSGRCPQSVPGPQKSRISTRRAGLRNGHSFYFSLHSYHLVRTEFLQFSYSLPVTNEDFLSLYSVLCYWVTG